jgi:hypothetical protein
MITNKLIDSNLAYIIKREIISKDYKMGFDYLPMNYDIMSRHKQNNEYMIAMWRNEDEHLQDAMFEFQYGERK